jgi:hypothetical protein
VTSTTLEGELKYRMANQSGAFALLRRGIEVENELSCLDPPL